MTGHERRCWYVATVTGLLFTAIIPILVVIMVRSLNIDARITPRRHPARRPIS